MHMRLSPPLHGTSKKKQKTTNAGFPSLTHSQDRAFASGRSTARPAFRLLCAWKCLVCPPQQETRQDDSILDIMENFGLNCASFVDDGPPPREVSTAGGVEGVRGEGVGGVCVMNRHACVVKRQTRSTVWASTHTSSSSPTPPGHVHHLNLPPLHDRPKPPTPLPPPPSPPPPRLPRPLRRKPTKPPQPAPLLPPQPPQLPPSFSRVILF